MKDLDRNFLSGWLQDLVSAWDAFWFSAQQPHALATIRICCGMMLTYVHVIWAARLSDFLGEHAWIDRQTIQQIHREDWAWSWLWYTDSSVLLGLHQALAIVVCVMMTFGVLTRITVPLAWFLTLMVCHRATLALFGLDQVVVMLSMYLMVSRCGSVWSVDVWLRNRFGGAWFLPESSPCVSNNIATRLIQIHLCVIYLFGGLSKMRGEMWFDGSALWYTIVNYEYQSLDLTWLGKSRIAISTLTAATIFWETFYCALVWPRLTRPIALAMALLVHAGIALGLGMITFGSIMIVANFAFIDPRAFQWLVDRVTGRKVARA